MDADERWNSFDKEVQEEDEEGTRERGREREDRLAEGHRETQSE